MAASYHFLSKVRTKPLIPAIPLVLEPRTSIFMVTPSHVIRKKAALAQSHPHPMPAPPHFSLCYLLRGPVFVLELQFVEFFVFTADGHEFFMNPFLDDPSLG